MAHARRPFVLALDIGSSSVRSALFRDNGKRIARSTASRKYSIRYTADGGAELDPTTVLRATRSCIEETGSDFEPAAISGSAFWHGLLGVDENGRALTPIFTWADARSGADAATLRRELSERAIQLRTGCMLRAPFWPAKLRWLRRTDRALFRRVGRWISPAAWIFERLFGVGLTSDSMASGTGLYSLRRRAWDEQLCDLCGIKSAQLGPLGDSADTIFAVIGDGAASNLGSGANRAGKIAINIGTSAAVRMILPARSVQPRQLPPGLFEYVVDSENVVVGGAVSNAGNLRDWCARELQLGDDAAIERALGREEGATNPLIVSPEWVQERAPDWPATSGGVIAGVTQATTAAQIFSAAICAVFYRLGAIVDSLEGAFGRADEIMVSGGVLKSPASLALLSDCLDRDLRLCTEMESSLRGAALHALRENGGAIAPLSRGRLVRSREALADKHRARRAHHSLG